MIKNFFIINILRLSQIRNLFIGFDTIFFQRCANEFQSNELDIA